MSKGGIAALCLVNTLKVEYLPSTFDIQDSIFDIYPPLVDSFFLEFLFRSDRTLAASGGAEPCVWGRSPKDEAPNL